jgi:putative membrane protein
VDRRAGALLLALAGYTYAIEYVGVTTGWPYGEFQYVVELGPTVAGVPLGLPLFFVPLALNALLFVDALGGERVSDLRVRVPAAVAVVLAVDLVLDPGAVALGFWTYGGGVYYGVPLSNYAGWLLSATVAVLLLDRSFDHRAVLARHENCRILLYDFASFVVLWGVVNVAFANWLAVLVAACLGAGLLVVVRHSPGGTRRGR